MWEKISINSQNSTVAPLNFGNGQVISYHCKGYNYLSTPGWSHCMLEKWPLLMYVAALLSNGERNPAINGGFPSQMTCNSESFSMSWRHHAYCSRLENTYTCTCTYHSIVSHSAPKDEENWFHNLFHGRHTLHIFLKQVKYESRSKIHYVNISHNIIRNFHKVVPRIV